MGTYNVTNTIKAANGTALSGVQVNIKLMPSGGFLSDSKSEVVRELNVVTNGSGVWTAALESNINILPSGTWYEVLEKIPKAYGGFRTWIIGVQNNGGPLYTLVLPEPPEYTDIIYSPPVGTVTKTDWSDLALLNGATQFPTSAYWNAQFRQWDDMVQFRGMLRLGDSASTWAANLPFASVPNNMRPSKLNRFPVNAVQAGQSVSTCMFITFDPIGTIYPVRDLQNAHVMLDACYYSLQP